MGALRSEWAFPLSIATTALCLGDYRFIELTADLRPALCSVVHGFAAERDHSLGQRDPNFSFTGHDELGAGPVQSWCLTQMRAAGKHTQIRIQLQGLLD